MSEAWHKDAAATADAAADAMFSDAVDAAVEMAKSGKKEEAEVTLHEALHECFFRTREKEVPLWEGRFEFVIQNVVTPFIGEEEFINKMGDESLRRKYFQARYECSDLYNQAHDHALKRDAAKGADPESENKVAQVFEKFWNKMKEIFHAVATAVHDKRTQRKLNYIADLIEGKTWGQRSAKMCAAAKVKAHEFGQAVKSGAVAAGKAMASAGASMKDAVSKHMPKKKTEKGQGQGV